MDIYSIVYLGMDYTTVLYLCKVLRASLKGKAIPVSDIQLGAQSWRIGQCISHDSAHRFPDRECLCSVDRCTASPKIMLRSMLTSNNSQFTKYIQLILFLVLWKTRLTSNNLYHDMFSIHTWVKERSCIQSFRRIQKLYLALHIRSWSIILHHVGSDIAIIINCQQEELLPCHHSTCPSYNVVLLQ